MTEGYRGSTEPIPAMKTVRPTSINDKGEIVTDGGHIVGKVIYRDARPASGTGSMRGLALCSRCGKGTVPPGQVCEACSATDPVCIYCGGVTVWLGMVADFVDPGDPQGRTYRQVNAERKHLIPIGTLVEMDDGMRLYIVRHDRDCDMTPLYVLGTADGKALLYGYPEDGLTTGYP